MAVAGLLLGFALLNPTAFAASVGEPFPAIRLPDAETGGEIEIADAVRGRVGVVIFMQTTCSVCKKEMEELRRIAAANPEVAVVAVSLDSGDAGRVVRFKRETGFPFTFLRDPEFTKPQLFGFRFTPGLVATGKDGIIAMVKSGYRNEDAQALEKKIEELKTR